VKLLVDTCVFGGAVEELRAASHDVTWSGAWERDPGDEELLILAHQEGRVVVTLDKDFGELAVVRGVRHSGILRLVGFRAEDQGAAARGALEKYARDLAAESIVTVERTRVRVRPNDRL
jgi:predicted nuclease of predicted toxin-antitoxin system